MEASSTFGYARALDGAYIGYRVDGDGPIDLVAQTDWPGHIDMDWRDPLFGPWLRDLSSFARVITHDHRGVGLSSRNVELPTLETRVDDLLAVLRTVGVRRPAFLGYLSTGAVGVLAAAMRPSLTRAIVWMEPTARFAWAPDYPWGATDAERQDELDFLDLWGTEAYGKAFWEDEGMKGNVLPRSAAEAIVMQSRSACTPDIARALERIWHETDVRGVLASVHTPTLLMVHGDRTGSIEEAEYIAEHMPSAEIRIMPGNAWTVEEQPAWTEQIRAFIGADQRDPELDKILATVLFTDIVDSTEHQTALGDREWKELVQRHHSIVREGLRRFNGTEADTAGDGFYATFEGPARAIQCAFDISEAIHDLGIEIRVGIHTGECQMIDGKVGGLAVSIGARVAAIAGPSEVLVSQTVRDLVAGSGLSFEDAGAHELKGIPDSWHLYQAVDRAGA